MEDSSSDDDDDDDIVAVVTMAAVSLFTAPKRQKIDHRQLSRAGRRRFHHQDALHCIRRDYLGLAGDPNTPLLGKEFALMFRISRGRFQLLMEHVMAAEIPFYSGNASANGDTVASLEARLLLPLKCLAYGVPPHTYIDYFQMSPPLARVCCMEFDKVIKRIYAKKYLKLPSAQDVKSIVNLHRKVHGVDGMIGSLDCSHTTW